MPAYLCTECPKARPVNNENDAETLADIHEAKTGHSTRVTSAEEAQNAVARIKAEERDTKKPSEKYEEELAEDDDDEEVGDEADDG